MEEARLPFSGHTPSWHQAMHFLAYQYGAVLSCGYCRVVQQLASRQGSCFSCWLISAAQVAALSADLLAVALLVSARAGVENLPRQFSAVSARDYHSTVLGGGGIRHMSVCWALGDLSCLFWSVNFNFPYYLRRDEHIHCTRSHVKVQDTRRNDMICGFSKSSGIERLAWYYKLDAIKGADTSGRHALSSLINVRQTQEPLWIRV